MSWTTLASRLDTTQRVLAGPLLRQVTATSATVWLALRFPATVRMEVMDPSRTVVLRGSQHSSVVGAGLHLVAVTASSATPLQEGLIYLYRLDFDWDVPASTLPALDPDFHSRLSYDDLGLPSFCLPPSDLNALRLLAGSCRIPHGDGQDALALADNLIAAAAKNAAERPHQMLLTGDQIYADDVSPVLLVMLTDAAKTLLGWDEDLPWPGGPKKAGELPPYFRKDVLEDTAGFTSEDLDSHLLTFGEYLAMYLFVWSDAAWPASADLPGADDLVQAGTAGIGDANAAARWKKQLDFYFLHPGGGPSPLEGHRTRLQKFRTVLPAVRRVLANVPSYMIFDDHEITDDWNMTRTFCEKVYGSDLGRRVIQNGLVAYALCQHWGNVPEHFSAAGSPGAALLTLLSSPGAPQYAQNEARLQSLVGVHSHAAMLQRHQASPQPDYGAYHDVDGFRYDYIVKGPAHEIVFTDTRSWRAFPEGQDGSVLLPLDQIRLQLDPATAIDNKALIVVLTTTAPPIEFIRSTARHTTLANLLQHHPDIYESWEMPSLPFDQLMATLSEKLPKVGGERRGALMLLTGDVHHSFATRLLYKAQARLGDPAGSPQPVTMAVVQLVASSLRKQTGNTLDIQRDGYGFTGKWYLYPLVAPPGTEVYAGWNVAPGTERRVGSIGVEAGGHWTANYPLRVDQPTIAVSPDRLALGLLGIFVGVALDPDLPPDYTYRLEYLDPELDPTLPASTPPSVPPLDASSSELDRQNALAAYQAAIAHYRTYSTGAASPDQIVGVNNLVDVTFAWDDHDPSKRLVNQRVTGWTKDGTTVRTTAYRVPLDPGDPKFPPIAPRTEA